MCKLFVLAIFQPCFYVLITQKYLSRVFSKYRLYLYCLVGCASKTQLVHHFIIRVLRFILNTAVKNLETIWLVIRFFSLVKNIVCGLWLVIRYISLVKKIVSVFPPFDAASQSGNVHNFRCFPWIDHGFKVCRHCFSRTIYRGPRKWKHKKENSTECCFAEFLTLKNESRLMEEIAPKEMNAYISEFIITYTVRKKDNNEDYEPSSLRSLMASFERYLKKTNSTFLSKPLMNRQPWPLQKLRWSLQRARYKRLKFSIRIQSRKSFRNLCELMFSETVELFKLNFLWTVF